MLSRRHLVASLTAAVLALGVTTLTACGNIAEQAMEEAAGNAIDGDVSVEDGQITVTESDGTQVSIGENVGVPDNWPSELPTPEGTLVSVSVGGDGSSVEAIWTADQTPAEATQSYGAALLAAGFTAGELTDMGGMLNVDYTGNGFTVNLVAMDADGTTSVLLSASRD